MTDCLLAVDLFSDFRHEDGEKLLASVRSRRAGLEAALDGARRRSLPVVFANDTRGIWDGDAGALVRKALAGPGADVLRALAPREGEAIVVKPRYSAFDLTPLALVLEQLGVERILLMGTATEMCVTQTAIDAKERGFHVSVITGACATVNDVNEATALRYLAAVVGARVCPDLESAIAAT